MVEGDDVPTWARLQRADGGGHAAATALSITQKSDGGWSADLEVMLSVLVDGRLSVRLKKAAKSLPVNTSSARDSIKCCRLVVEGKP